MNLKDYQAGRAYGLELALRIVEKDGVEELRKEVSIRGRTRINTAARYKDLSTAIAPIRQLIQETYTLLVIDTLRTELEFGQKRIQRFMDHFYLKQQCVADDLVSFQDYIDAMKAEIDLEMDTPALEAEGLVKAREKRERRASKNISISNKNSRH